MLDTLLIASNILITIMGECRRSKCTDIEISDCLKIHRDIGQEEDTHASNTEHIEHTTSPKNVEVEK